MRTFDIRSLDVWRHFTWCHVIYGVGAIHIKIVGCDFIIVADLIMPEFSAIVFVRNEKTLICSLMIKM